MALSGKVGIDTYKPTFYTAIDFTDTTRSQSPACRRDALALVEQIKLLSAGGG